MRFVNIGAKFGDAAEEGLDDEGDLGGGRLVEGRAAREWARQDTVALRVKDPEREASFGLRDPNDGAGIVVVCEPSAFHGRVRHGRPGVVIDGRLDLNVPGDEALGQGARQGLTVSHHDDPGRLSQRGGAEPQQAERKNASSHATFLRRSQHVTPQWSW